MEGSGMKYENDLIFVSALPDAPLAMPKQSLERRRSLLSSLRNVLASFPWL
jgi:hypothetical protein